jgi:tRNA A-37 threonylcarbamoyl transferase component Bud32
MPEIEPGSRDYWQEVEEIFHAALEQPVQSRREFLAARCGNERLEREVRELLEGYETQERLSAASPADPDVGRRYGPYEVVRKIGAGGMGEVYLAQRREDFERQVAIKVISNRLLAAPLLIERFRQERQILATLDHPNIARLLDGGVAASGQPYLVMEYVEGIRLDRYCDQHALTLEQRLALFRKVCAAVEYAHRKLVVHRDLKPNNILVNEQGEPKLLDFGVAKVLEPEESAVGDTLTMTGAVLVTPRYASPERLAGATATVASDVYSLGVVLYELIAGRPPYAGSDSSPAQLIGAMMTRELPPPSTIAPDVLKRPLRGGLDRIAGRALGKRPEDRYESVALLSADIERYLSGRAVRPRTGRRRWVLAGASALLLAIAIWLAARAGQEPFAPKHSRSFRPDYVYNAVACHTRHQFNRLAWRQRVGRPQRFAGSARACAGGLDPRIGTRPARWHAASGAASLPAERRSGTLVGFGSLGRCAELQSDSCCTGHR